MMRALSILALAVLTALPALAADNTLHPATPARATATAAGRSPVASFTLDGIAFRYQLPRNFCLPSPGEMTDRAARTAAGDSSNVTNLSFDDCASMAKGGDLLYWGMIKTPRSMLGQDAGTRDSFIAILKTQFGDGTFERSMAQAATPDQNVRPLGVDAYAAYVGGTMRYEGHVFAAVWAITAVKHRGMVLYVYGPYTAKRDVDTVLAIAQRSVQQFVTLNEAP